MIDPSGGFKDQVTAVLLAPLTVAENWAVWPAERVAREGERVTATLTGLLMVSEPGVVAMVPADPSSSASTGLESCRREEPAALGAMAAVMVATMPAPMGFVFKPANRQVLPLQDNDLPALEAAGPD